MKSGSSWRETTIAGTTVETIFSTGWLPSPPTPHLSDEAWRDAHHRFVICVNDAVFFHLEINRKNKQHQLYVLLGKRSIWPMPGEWMDGGAKTPFVQFEEIDLVKKLYKEYNYSFEPNRLFRIQTDATDYIWLEKSGMERHDHGHPKGLLVTQSEKEMILARELSTEFAGYNIYKIDQVINNDDIHPTIRHVIKDSKIQIERAISNLLVDIYETSYEKILDHITLTVQGKIKKPETAIQEDETMQTIVWSLYQSLQGKSKTKTARLLKEAQEYEEKFIKKLTLRQEQYFK